MEIWGKSDYLWVFLCLLQLISRPILFPLSLNKQPVSLARCHNWLPLLLKPAALSLVTGFNPPPQPKAVHSHLADRSSDQEKIGRERKTLCLSLSVCVYVCVKVLKKITCSFNKITEVTEDQWLWNCICREINSSLIVIRRKNQICPFHAFIKYFLFHSEQKESASSSFESRYLLKHICSLLSLDSNNTIANCEPLCSQPLKLRNWTKLLFFFTHRKLVPSLCSN